MREKNEGNKTKEKVQRGKNEETKKVKRRRERAAKGDEEGRMGWGGG